VKPSPQKQASRGQTVLVGMGGSVSSGIDQIHQMGGQSGQGEDIQTVVLEDCCHEAPVPLSKPIEIAPGNLETGDVAVALDTQESLFQNAQTTIRQAVSKEPSRRVEEVYMGEAGQRILQAVHDKPCGEEMDIETFAVEADQKAFFPYHID